MKTKLNPTYILEKEFKVGMRGYNQEEVDRFLDDVIADYEQFEARIQELEQQLRQARERSEEPAAPPVYAQRSQPTNYDILQRLSKLEKKVFGDKLYGE